MILIEKDVPVAMTDGVQLATDIYRLQEGLPAPVLLIRTVIRELVVVSLAALSHPVAQE